MQQSKVSRAIWGGKMSPSHSGLFLFSLSTWWELHCDLGETHSPSFSSGGSLQDPSLVSPPPGLAKRLSVDSLLISRSASNEGRHSEWAHLGAHLGELDSHLFQDSFIPCTHNHSSPWDRRTGGPEDGFEENPTIQPAAHSPTLPAAAQGSGESPPPTPPQ